MRAWLARLRRFAHDRRGAAAILLAGGLAFMLGCAAFAIDSASLYLASRKLQGTADAAALAAAGNLTNAQARATQAIADDYSAPGTVNLNLTTGTYTPDPTRTPANRYVAGGAGQNAAKVVLSTNVNLYFGLATLGRRSVPVSRSATAERTNLASFSIGSRLASLNGGVANALTSALTGSTISLSVMDYQSMANANVNLFDFVNALHTSAGLTAGSFNDTLNASVTLPTVLNALASTLNQAGNTAAAAAVTVLANANITSGPIQLKQMIDLGPIGTQDHVGSTSVSVQAWDLVRTTLETANAGRQLQLNLGAGVPGLASTTVYLSIGDHQATSPWLTLTGTGQPIISTAQTRLYIDTTVGTAALGLAGLAQVHLPLYVEVAAAQAQLSALTCSQQAGTAQVTLSVQPSIGHASIATVNPAQLANQQTPVTETPANIVTLPLIQVTGSARINLSDGTWHTVTFNQDEIAAHTVKTVSSSGTVAALATSLNQQMQLSVSILGISIPLTLITQLVGSVLSAGAPLIDGLTSSLLNMLGIQLGQADTTVNGVRCGAGVLVG